MAPIVEVLASKEALIQRAADCVEAKIRLAIETQGQCSIALAGGSTPKPLYASLAKADLPWDKLHCFWGDERYVPVDHPDSNEGMARKAWLDQVPIPAANIHGTPTLNGDPAVDAATYDAHLRNFFAVTGQDFPVFDIILLGLGDDGHTASLFPHTAALEVCDRCITVGNKDGQPRLTFTIPLINAARSVIFLVAGANKQPALKAIFQGEGGDLDRQYPARFIRPQGELCWLLDATAGESLVLESTLTLLRSYSCVTPKPVSPEEKVPLQKAIATVIQRSEGQNFGICADTVEQALEALSRYLKGLGYSVEMGDSPEHSITGPAYLKYNLQRQAFYFDDYVGDYRGVLISCLGEDEVAGTYGHFPLDLFN